MSIKMRDDQCVKCMHTNKCQKLQTSLGFNKRSKYTHLKCLLQILSFL